MLKFSRLPLSLLALTIAAPVLAAEPAATGTTAAPATTAAKPATAPQATVAPKASTLDLNTASAADLKGLPGITDAEAAKIVQARPFKDPNELVAKKILTEAEFAKIKDRVVAGHPKS